jgi:hypothetical protein
MGSMSVHGLSSHVCVSFLSSCLSHVRNANYRLCSSLCAYQFFSLYPKTMHTHSFLSSCLPVRTLIVAGRLLHPGIGWRYVYAVAFALWVPVLRNCSFQFCTKPARCFGTTGLTTNVASLEKVATMRVKTAAEFGTKQQYVT